MRLRGYTVTSPTPTAGLVSEIVNQAFPNFWMAERICEATVTIVKKQRGKGKLGLDKKWAEEEGLGFALRHAPSA